MRVAVRVLLGACLLAAAVPAPASAASTYSAPLRAAVRQLPVAPENTSPYDRTRYFGGWGDTDRDCQSSRHEVLAAEAADERLSSSGCTVVSGTWRSFYDGRTYPSPSQVQIDHLIPVSEAWDSGAHRWTQARRVSFYNDLGVAYALNGISAALNQAKADKGPEAWMPPANRCRYVEIWTAMKVRWGFTVDSAERSALIRYADGCPDNQITVNRL